MAAVILLNAAVFCVPLCHGGHPPSTTQAARPPSSSSSSSSPVSPPHFVVPLLRNVWQSGPDFITITLVRGRFDGTSLRMPGSFCSVMLQENEEIRSFRLLLIFVAATLLLHGARDVMCADISLCHHCEKPWPGATYQKTVAHTRSNHTHTHTLTD